MDDFFEEIRKIMKMFSNIDPFDMNEPAVYGFSISYENGKPKIREFGNIKKGNGQLTVNNEMEPLVNVFDKGDKIYVVAELPGVEKEQIKLDINGNKLILTATGKDRKYRKIVELNSPVENEADATFKNGILEVHLKKKKTNKIKIK